MIMAKSFLLANSTDLTAWSNRRDAQSSLPQLLRRLITATVDKLERITVRADEGVHLGGWDGVIRSASPNAFVPEGISAWEAGTDGDVKGKADGDYDKRSKDPLKLIPAETTFVFVTSRRWKNRDDWAEKKRAEGIWRDVRAYDADDLATWLEMAPAVHIWLSYHIGKSPEGVEDLSTFWSNWANVTRPPLAEGFVIAGRTASVGVVHDWISTAAGAIALRGETREEAIAFLAAAFRELPERERDSMLWRAVVVHEPNVWRTLSAPGCPMLLIPAFSDRSTVTAAVADGHHVAIPLGRDEPPVRGTIELPRPRREEARAAIIGMGIKEERANELARIARSSLGAVRRALGVNPAGLIPKWASQSAARELLPAVLVGRWDEGREADQAIVAKLAGREYSAYAKVLDQWAGQADPPVRRIGRIWTVVSRDDAWTLSAHRVNDDDLALLECTVIEACGEINPAYDLAPHDRWQAALLGKSLKHSPELREGLAGALAMMATLSEETPLHTSPTAQQWANRVVGRLLENARTWQAWASLGSQLRYLAEAAPEEFLSAVDRELGNVDTCLRGLFTDGHPVLCTSPHTELLWALETLAWSPDFLAQAAVALARLAAIDPGGQTANRPANSLQEVFLPWHPSTCSSVARRLCVLEMICKREPATGWSVLFSLVPNGMGMSTGGAKPRWRDWAAEEPHEVRVTDYVRMVTEVVRMLIDRAGIDAGKWSKLVEESDNFPEEQFEAAVAALSRVDPSSISPVDQLELWGSLRAVLSRHREFGTADWAMTDTKLAKLDTLYARFKPDDLADQFAWLFSGNPNLPEGNPQEWEDKCEAVRKRQEEAVAHLIAERGFEAACLLCEKVELPMEVGEALGRSSISEQNEHELLNSNLASQIGPRRNLALGYLFGRSTLLGTDWAKSLRSKPMWDQWTASQRADYFVMLPFDGTTWDMIEAEGHEVRRLYWIQVGIYGRGRLSNELRDRAAREMYSHGQFSTAIHLLALYSHDKNVAAPSGEFVATLLEEALKCENSATVTNWGALTHDVSLLLDIVAASEGVDDARAAKLEWSFLPLLKRRHSPRVLHKAMANEPAFFVEILSLAYKASDEPSTEVDERDRLRATLAYDLLSDPNWLPGRHVDSTFNGKNLVAWVYDVRRLAADAKRERVADRYVGQIIARGPIDPDGSWPHRSIRDLLEELACEKIEGGIEMGIFNNRGMVRREIGEGGEQERDIAERYGGYARQLADEWPRTSRLMRRIADSYCSDARRVDTTAELDEEMWA